MVILVQGALIFLARCRLYEHARFRDYAGDERALPLRGVTSSLRLNDLCLT